MIKTDVFVPVGYSKSDIYGAVSLILPIEKDEIREMRILKCALDISDKSAPRYRLSVGLAFSAEREAGLLKMKKKVSPVEDMSLEPTLASLPSRPIVVGCGPCGLFAALYLAESGASPIILERGLSVEERRCKVDSFKMTGEFDPECNVQFGEGGAGTYSDGKLKVGGMDKYKMKVLSEFVRAGAPNEIIYTVGAHLGTDKLSDIVKSIRNRIISLGGTFIFGAKLTDIIIKDGRLSGVKYTLGGETVEEPCENLILAIGHSAKDTFQKLYARGVRMVARGFGVGMRIEHPREYINELVYGKNYDTRLGTSSYHLVTHLKNGRSVYSFCMCPGGTVVAAASEPHGVVTNGMSEYLRDGENSNAAFLVSLTPDDFGSAHPLAGMDLQRKIERSAFTVGGEGYVAPAVNLGDFVKKSTEFSGFKITPTYPRGVSAAHPEDYLPEYVTDSLRASISDFDQWMPGFYYPDAIMTGAETRSTSPVRILRGEGGEAEGIFGLYPAGEGAGYSGGIVSSAVDGIRAAEALLQKYKL